MTTLNWKPVKLEGVFNEGDFEGLIGIEELTDYGSGVLQDSKQKNVKKRKSKADEKFDTDQDTNKNAPGAFVRPPNFTRNFETPMEEPPGKKKRKKAAKQKIEIGEQINDAEKYTIDDLKAWEFAKLPDELMEGLAQVGFLKPTLIQEQTLPPAIFGRRDILGVAETGSGKTLAFGLPILAGIMDLKKKNNETQEDDNVSEDDLQENESDDSSGELDEEIEESEDEDEEIIEDSEDDQHEDESQFAGSNDFVVGTARFKKPKPLYALILTPTRELAVQVKNHIQNVARFAGIKAAVVIGGMAAVKQERILARGPEIVVATPGRLWELMQLGDAHLSQMHNIRYLVIDETDRMLERGHYEELQQLLEHLNVDEEKRKKRQNFVFSATLTLGHDLPIHTKKKLKRNASKVKTGEQKLKEMRDLLGMTNPKLVDASGGRPGTAGTLTECKITCTSIDDKDLYTYYFICRHPGRTLIFCNSVGSARRLATLLTSLNIPTSPLHSSMQQRQRLRNLEKFRDDPKAVLVATDIAARGLDIPHVEHVLHYHVPRTGEIYVHRSGRTARATNTGITVLLVAPEEVLFYKRICRTTGREEDLPTFPVHRRLVDLARERIKLARLLDAKERTVKKRSADSGWLKKAAEDMDMILDELNDRDDFESNHDMANLKRETSVLRKQLTVLLSKPLFPADIDHTVFDQVEGKAVSLKDESIAPELRDVTAIDLMKNQSEVKVTKERKMFRPKITVAQKKKERKIEKQKEKKNRRKVKKEKLMKGDDM